LASADDKGAVEELFGTVALTLIVGQILAFQVEHCANHSSNIIADSEAQPVVHSDRGGHYR
tara:strand:- start:144 stop:326 length:183 start_codon:yes stop_codon:yes gene_type:complete